MPILDPALEGLHLYAPVPKVPAPIGRLRAFLEARVKCLKSSRRHSDVTSVVKRREPEMKSLFRIMDSRYAPHRHSGRPPDGEQPHEPKIFDIGDAAALDKLVRIGSAARLESLPDHPGSRV